MAYSPYQTAGAQANLWGLSQKGRFGEQQAGVGATEQKSKMKEDFEEQLKKAQRKARKKSGKNKWMGQALNLAGMFLGPAGAAVTGGIASLLQGQQQKKGLEMLKGVDRDRFKGTFLEKPMQDYWEEAQDLQMSSGDVLGGGLASALTSFGTSKMLGGSKETGGLGKKMFEKTPETGFLPTASVDSVGIKAGKDMFGLKDLTSTGKGQLSFKPEGAEMWKGTVDPFKGELGKNMSFGVGGAKVQAPDLVSKNLSGQNIQGLGGSMRDMSVGSTKASGGIRQPDLISRPTGKTVAYNPSQKELYTDTGGGKATPMKTLWEELSKFGQDGVDEETQQAMMIPQLMQMLMGQIGGR